MNDYLDPPATADEQAALLTRVGFPFEGGEPRSGSDARQGYETTSNRGDCLCHVGLAREIAAVSGRALKAPWSRPKATGPPAESIVSVTNREPARCPLYTARIIRGVRVGQSPGWIADRLRAIDQVPRNNIVDASNFVLFELGQPTHVFDLARVSGPEIIVRMAAQGERFLPIGEGAAAIGLSKEDLVIADRKSAVALAGVMGGAPSAVTGSTTDVLLEAAAFDPVAVRNASRRHGIESGSSYRFERGVHPGQVGAAAERLAELILETAGGTLASGAVAAGAPLPPPRRVSMRVDRCRAILGMPVRAERMVAWLAALGFQPEARGNDVHCTVPVHRLDVDREIDLIEEVGRMMGHDELPVKETIEVRVGPLQPAELARRAVGDALAGMGYVEAVTHGLIEARDAGPFLTSGTSALETSHESAGEQAGVLRPSILPGLLRVLARNHDNGVRRLRLFEAGSSFLRTAGGHAERQTLGLLADVEDPGEGLRPVRGVVERLVAILLGPEAALQVTPDDGAPWFAPGAVAAAGGRPIGRLGLIAPETAGLFGVDGPVAAAELELRDLYDVYPPGTQARELPGFPAVERDVSAIVDESVPWASIRRTADDAGLEHVEAIEFVTAFRGKPVGAGRKSVTLRLRFRAPDRTLQHGEVDAQVKALVEALQSGLKAEIRR